MAFFCFIFFSPPEIQLNIAAPVTFGAATFRAMRVLALPGHAPGSLTRGDHIGCSDSVEQAHCTLGAVKRYRALLEGGGLPNFLSTTFL